MITAGPLSVARHRTVISWRLECATCGANTIHTPCQHRDSFVADVSVDEVRAATLELWFEPAQRAQMDWRGLSQKELSVNELSENAEERTLEL
jgi:hypothetical protein